MTMPEYTVTRDASSVASSSGGVPTSPGLSSSVTSSTTATATTVSVSPSSFGVLDHGRQVACQVILFSYPSEGLSRLKRSRVCFAAAGTDWTPVRVRVPWKCTGRRRPLRLTRPGACGRSR